MSKAKDQIVIDRDTLRKIMAGQRQDIVRKRCGAREALEILDVSRPTFYKLLKDPNTCIKKSAGGKYNLESIYREAERLDQLEK